jgi:hypothetical protein
MFKESVWTLMVTFCSGCCIFSRRIEGTSLFYSMKEGGWGEEEEVRVLFLVGY